MRRFERFFLWLVLCFVIASAGCGGGTGPNKTASSSELEKYLAEHTELAEAEPIEFHE
jgi:hypothetical protein